MLRRAAAVLSVLVGQAACAKHGSHVAFSVEADGRLDQVHGLRLPPASVPPQGTVMVDGGSSGSKIFSFGTPSDASIHSLEIKSECGDGHDGRDRFKGATILQFDATQCQGWVSVGDKGTKNPLAPMPNNGYAKFLLARVKELHEANGDCPSSGCPPPTNKVAVPMMATAGMRLLSLKDNSKIWGKICGQSSDGYQFAPPGPLCGTIPGTQEAWYEYLANLATHTDDKLRAVFTVGGASAQIALPLKSDEVEAFREMMARVSPYCKDLNLAGETDSMPLFNVKEVSDMDRCIYDFMDVKEVADIPLTLQGGLRKNSVTHVGLISFLGLGKQDLQESVTFGVAGGVNSIENWAIANKCDHDAIKLQAESVRVRAAEECEQKFQKALARDMIWNQVQQFFQDGGASHVEVFNFNTAASNPIWKGAPANGQAPLDQTCVQDLLLAPAGDDPDFWALQDEFINRLERAIDDRIYDTHDFSGFGFNNQNTLSKAGFTFHFNRLVFNYNRKINKEVHDIHLELLRTIPLVADVDQSKEDQFEEKMAGHVPRLKTACAGDGGTFAANRAVEYYTTWIRELEQLAHDALNMPDKKHAHQKQTLQQAKEMLAGMASKARELRQFKVEYGRVDWTVGAKAGLASSLVNLFEEETGVLPAYFHGAMIDQGLV